MNNKIELNLGQNHIQKTNNHLINEFQSDYLNSNKRSQFFHNFTQNKPRSNIIKVNKGKLPADFFPKCTSYEKKIPTFKLNLNSPLKSQRQDERQRPRRVQSEKLHDSPDKASFFGFFQNQNINKITDSLSSTKNLSLNRKFQTRQQPKRDHSQRKRRLTPGNHSHRNEIYQLFKTPINYDQQKVQIVQTNLSNITNNESLNKICKLSPRKQHISKYREIQQISNPQKLQHEQKSTHQIIDQSNSNSLIMNNPSLSLETYSLISPKKKPSNFKTIQKNSFNINLQLNNHIEKQKQAKSNKLDYTFAAIGDTIDLHNMTFFNIKSSCLPPIKKN